MQFIETMKLEGITGNKYIGTKDMLDNGESVPSRRCFCPNGNCGPSGTLNISSCKFGAPAFVSMPHFLSSRSKLYREHNRNVTR